MRLIHPTLDLTKYAWSHTKGDLRVYGTWRYDDDDRQWVPCLAIVPAHHLLSFERVTPCIVTVDLAWIWSEEHGDEALAGAIIGDFLATLGMAPTPRNAYRVLDLIRDHLEDLIKRIPPRPPEKTVAADAFVTDAAGKQRHAEIKEDA